MLQEKKCTHAMYGVIASTVHLLFTLNNSFSLFTILSGRLDSGYDITSFRIF